MTPRVSVVVPAYNNAATLAATLDSIIKQTFKDFELIVADHSSSDSTVEIARHYEQSDSRVRIVSTEAGGGASQNWNRVTDLAVGEFVKLVCGDDLLHQKALEEQVKAFDKFNDSSRPIGFVASRRDLVDLSGRTFMRDRGLGTLRGKVDGREALRLTVRSGANLFGEPACVLIRRELLASAGGWKDMRYYLDLGGYAGVLAVADMIALPQTLASFRVGGGQWSVHLARLQSQDAATFHRFAQKLAPGYINDRDVWLGDIRAKLMSWKRRAAYVVLAFRNR